MKLYCPEGDHFVKVGKHRGERKLCPTHRCAIFTPRKEKALKQTSRQTSTEEARAKAHFEEVVLAEPCYFLDDTLAGEPRRPGHECLLPLDAHHLIEKSWLRRELSLPYDELLAVMYDPIIGAPLCRRAHDLVTFGRDKIYRDELDDDLVDFCVRFDEGHPDERSLLERLYLESPEREVVG